MPLQSHSIFIYAVYLLHGVVYLLDYIKCDSYLCACPLRDMHKGLLICVTNKGQLLFI